jgi:exodeoxyribonuclease VII large subunit
VIIRGGGAQSDLSCFNSYWLASHIAQFPLPVLTGIGHEQDETVADMVAHTRLKTPTAVAEFLLAKYQDEESFQHELSLSLIEASRSILTLQTNQLMKLAFTVKPLVQSMVEGSRKRLAIASVMIENASQKLLTGAFNKTTLIKFRMISSSKHFLLQQKHLIYLMKNRLENAIPAFIKQQHYRLEILTNKHHYNDPQHILKRGYSITLLQGKPVKDATEVKEGDVVDTLLHLGRLRSKVTEKKEDNTKKSLRV